MKATQIHLCQVIDEKKINDIVITTYDDEWVIKDEFSDTSVSGISFCPYCGIKLENEGDEENV